MAGFGALAPDDELIGPPPNPAAPSDNVSAIVRALAAQLGNTIMAPGRALQSTTPITTEEMIKPAADMAGLAMTGGVGGVARAAGESVLGAAPVRMVDSPSMGKTIRSFDDIRGLLEQHDPVFVRWSQSLKHDLAPGSKSRDYQSGTEHAGLSAVPISRDLSDGDIFKFLRDYGYLRSGGNEGAQPRVYAGKVVGKDSDGAYSIVPQKHLGTLSNDFVRFIDDDANLQRMSLAADLQQGRSMLAQYANNPPPTGTIPFWTPERVAEIESRLASLGGLPTMPGTRKK